METSGNPCWIATRDIRAGQEWGAAILTAIESAQLIVLVFSAYSNGSPHVRRELAHASRCDLPVRVVRVDSAEPAGSFRLLASEFAASAEPKVPFEDRLAALCAAVSSGSDTAESAAAAHRPVSDSFSRSAGRQGLLELLGKVVKANYWIAGIRVVLSAAALAEYFTDHTGTNQARTYIAFSLPLHFAGVAWVLAVLAIWLAAGAQGSGVNPGVVWSAFLRPASFLTVPRRLIRDVLQVRGASTGMLKRASRCWIAVSVMEVFSLAMLVLAGADDISALGLLLPDLLLTVLWCPTAAAMAALMRDVETEKVSA